MKDLAKNLMFKGVIVKEGFKSAVREKCSTRKKGDKAILMELGIVLVAVVLLIVFRDAIKPVITDLVTTAQTKIKAVFGGVTP